MESFGTIKGRSCAGLAILLRMATALCILILLPLSAQSTPRTLSYQGRIIKTDGSPLRHSSVSFIFKILNPSGTCVIYREQISGLDMSNSNGLFDLAIGSGAVVYPTTGSFNILDAFNNSTASYSCEGGTNTYSPSAGDNRRLRVQFWDGLGWSALESDLVIRTVPYAAYANAAERLGTYLPSEFVLNSSVPSCAVGEYLSFNSGTWACVPLGSMGLGTVTSITVGTGLTGGTITTTGSIGLGTELAGVNALATTGFVSRTGPGAYSTSTSINLTSDVSGILPVANGGTGATTLAAALTNILPPQSGNSGRILQTDGTTATWVVPPATGITALTGEVTASGSGSVAATITDGAVTSAKILDGTIATADIGNGQVTDAKIASLSIDKITSGSGKYLSYLPNNAACADGEVLKWNNSNSRWICGTDNEGAGGITALSGDVSTTGSGAVTVTVDRVKNVPITLTSPATGQYLKYNSGSWVNSAIAISDITNLSTQLAAKIDSSQMPANCSAGQTLTFTSATGTWACSTISVSGSNFASATANYVLAAPNGSAGAPSFRALVAADLPNSGATAGTYTKVTVDAKGRVTTGASLASSDITTALGYTPVNKAGDTVTGALTVNSTLTAGAAIVMGGNTVIDSGGGWHRTYGNTGWYNGTHGGGIYMIDATYVRVYGSKVFHSDNTIQTGTAMYSPAYYYTSDRRLKENIETLKNPMEKTLQLRGVAFDWKSTKGHDIGFIAQEVEKVLPETVSEQKDEKLGTIKTVKYGNIVALAIEALKELWRDLRGVDSRVKSLEAKMSQVEEQNQLLIEQNQKLIERLEALEKRVPN
ncbi:hypothetical protein AZI86_06040 [Bdellovibrio bacteriovorus]|uniref:Peptidase S74 domain-containing protein n=1 Tax=Bdellovibrio bacteriovorus TaxID=959 RepID=A0A150WQ27_BDEBC|nr:tail fiber domain-containing protein [Bdellovibrio bacteriovorus]KYG66603.1 hypothetical protein AZI86_06040 [Bdellovibrio bacteriovorus]